MRQPAAGTPALSNQFGRVLRHLNRECEAYIANSPDTPLCARTLGDYWSRNQARDAARHMFLLYRSHARQPDEQVERALKSLDGSQ